MLKFCATNRRADLWRCYKHFLLLLRPCGPRKELVFSAEQAITGDGAEAEVFMFVRKNLIRHATLLLYAAHAQSWWVRALLAKPLEGAGTIS